MDDFGLLLIVSGMITLIGIIALFMTPIKLKSHLAISIIILNALLTSFLSVQALTKDTIELVVFAGEFFNNITIRIDALSAWFILIINFTCITGALFGSGYLKAYNKSDKDLTLHWILFALFQLSMVWVCMLQHAIAFLIAWEIMSLTSMMLVIFDHRNPHTLKAGINYLVQMHISVVFLSIGFIWLNFQTGSFDFDAFMTYFGTNSNIGLFLVLFVGFGLKAGFIPLHGGLLAADPAAPSHISGVMSGVLVKLGIYGIFRVASYLKSDFIILGEILIIVSVSTGLFGILNAAVHRNAKRMLAFCTVENIGIIGMGMGVGLIGLGNNSPILYYLGFGGALLHVLNHSLFKSLLFFSTGSVCQQTGSPDMEKLGGIIKYMPRTALIFLIGALGIGGIPPFNGFISEFLIYSGLIEGIQLQSINDIILFVLALAGMSVIGGLSILTFTKTFSTIFLGKERQPISPKPKEVSLSMLFPQYLIIAMMIAVALFPQFFLQVVGTILSGLTKSLVVPQPVEFANYISIMQNISVYSLIFTGLILSFWGIRYLMLREKSQLIQTTWRCGYPGPITRMQYTGKSFSKSLSKMFNFIVIERKQYEELEAGELFPKERNYASHYHDFFEFRIIHVITNQLVYAANYFKFIQNGRVQSYVLYGIVFIMTIFLLTVFNILS